jgi:hypothetical protein
VAATSALREILARFGVTFDDKALKRGTASINQAVAGLKSMAGIIGSAFIVRGLARFVGETIRMGDALDKTSQQLGLSVNQFEGLSHAAELAGVDAAAFGNSMGQIQQRALLASEGSKQAADAFRELGVDVRDASGNLKDGEQLLFEVSDGLRNMEDQNRRVGLSMILMGRSGRRLLPMLTQGSDAIREQAAESRRLTGDLTDYVAVSVELTDTITRFRRGLMGLRAALAVVLLPIIDRTTRALTWLGVKIREVTEQSHAWELAMIAIGIAAVALGIKLTIAFAGPLLTIGLVAAAVILVGLAIDDLWVAIEGGDSIIGSSIDELLAYTGTWWRFRNMVNEAKQAVQDLWEVLQAVGQFMSGVFGADPNRPEDVTAGFIADAFDVGRSVREFVSPGEQREGMQHRRDELRRQRFRDRRRRARLVSEAREEGGGAFEGEIRLGRPTVGPGGRIGRIPAQRFQGGQWVTMGDSHTEVNVTTQATDPEEVGRIAGRAVREANEQERRRTLAAIEGSSS